MTSYVFSIDLYDNVRDMSEIFFYFFFYPCLKVIIAQEGYSYSTHSEHLPPAWSHDSIQAQDAGSPALSTLL